MERTRPRRHRALGASGEPGGPEASSTHPIHASDPDAGRHSLHGPASEPVGSANAGRAFPTGATPPHLDGSAEPRRSGIMRVGGNTMDLTADALVERLRTLRSDAEKTKIRKHVKAPDTEIIGVRMKFTFDTAREFTSMPLAEVERLLDSSFYEARIAAVSILDFRARRRRLTDDEHRALYELYLLRHDRINNWDLVDRAAPRVVGAYLLDKPRDVLYDLARSRAALERRTAITATFWLVRQGEIEDALRIAEILLEDPSELVTKPVGVALREAGRVDEDRLVAFLRRHHERVPRVTLRFAVEKLPQELRRDLMRR